jgi:hypothetical protein
VKVGDLVKLKYGFEAGEEEYYALLIAYDSTCSGHYKFLFLDDGTTEEYNQETFDYEEVGVEVISETR